MDIRIEGSSSRTIRLTDEVTVRPFLSHALAATLACVGVPLALVALLTFSFDPPPAPIWVALASLAVGLCASAAGRHLWLRVPESDAIEFGELMLWRWMQRHAAERRIRADAHQLGLDATGAATAELSGSRRRALLEDLTSALQAKDGYARGHSRRVARLVVGTAKAMGLAGKEVERASAAAAVHDVGNLFVPDEILRKHGALTRLEAETMKDHAVRGAKMLEPEGDASVSGAVRHHHERWDGRGYPDALVAHEIPLAARLISVADTYDALRSTRAYRAKRSRRKAIDILKAETGKQLDPEVVDAFLSSLQERPAAHLPSVPSDALAVLASWIRRRGSALAMAAVVVVAAFGSGALIGEAERGGPASLTGVASDPGDADEPGDVIEDPPAGEDTVLGTRFGPGERRRACRRPPSGLEWLLLQPRC